MSIWLLLLIVMAALAYLTHPSMRYRRMRRWRGQAFAHRGLHDESRGIVENTMPAFLAARDAGFGIELDIRFSRDMQVVVFHDDDLMRLAGDSRRVRQLTLDELQSLRLLGREQARIPTLRQVLDAVGGEVPLLIELKNGADNPRLCRALMEHLEDYPGEYLVQSFSPLIVAWFRFHAPGVTRGQLVDALPSYRPAVNGTAGFFMAGLLSNFASRPDFVSYNANAPRFFSPHFQRFMFRTPLAAWTVRDPAIAALVARRGEILIFESPGTGSSDSFFKAK